MQQPFSFVAQLELSFNAKLTIVVSSEMSLPDMNKISKQSTNIHNATYLSVDIFTLCWYHHLYYNHHYQNHHFD